MNKKATSPLADLLFDSKTSILFIKVYEDVEMTEGEILKHYDVIKELTQNKHYVALIDAEHFFPISNEALRLSAQPEVLGNRIATAYYSYSVANRLTTHFFKNNIKPAIPVEYFKTKAQALEWVITKISEFEATKSTKLI